MRLIGTVPCPAGAQHTAPLHWSVSLADRLTMLPFLLAFLDYTSNEETFLK